MLVFTLFDVEFVTENERSPYYLRILLIMRFLWEKCDTCDSKKCKTPAVRTRARTCRMEFSQNLVLQKSVLSDSALSVQAKQFISNREERNAMTDTSYP